jgi:hypothetical protein
VWGSDAEAEMSKDRQTKMRNSMERRREVCGLLQLQGEHHHIDETTRQERVKGKSASSRMTRDDVMSEKRHADQR